MARVAKLILQMPIDGELDRSVREHPPAAVSSGDVALDAAPATDDGRLEPPDVGDVVASYASFEVVQRDAADVRRAIAGAGEGTEPLVVVVEAADTLRDEELAPVLDAAGRTDRAVILRVMADG